MINKISALEPNITWNYKYPFHTIIHSAVILEPKHESPITNIATSIVGNYRTFFLTSFWLNSKFSKIIWYMDQIFPWHEVQYDQLMLLIGRNHEWLVLIRTRFINYEFIIFKRWRPVHYPIMGISLRSI